MSPRASTAAVALAGASAFGLVSVVLGLDPSSPAGFARGSGWIIPALLASSGIGLLGIAVRFGLASPVALAIGLLGSAFLTGLPSAGPWRGLTPLAAGWLLAVAEFAAWSIDLRVRGLDAAAIARRRLAAIAGLVAAGAVVAAIAETGINPIDLDGLELTILGLLGAVALVGVAASLAWRLRPLR